MNAGIYIHIPFCKSRCSYCDFATDVYRSNEAVERYLSALCQEILTSEFPLENFLTETLYFGGGTPSLLKPEQLEKILKTLSKRIKFSENLEFTLEINPATVSLDKLLAFKSLGVNRASFGVQTFDDKALKLLARGHNAGDARQTFKLLKKTDFDNVSFDLIAGLPNQTLENWRENLTFALELNPEHLSLYLLEIHESTPLAEQIRSRRQPLPDEDLAGEMYQLMLEKVVEKDFRQYEISNFSKEGFYSKHNLKYWLCQPVFGFGVSAHSFDGKTRFANERDTLQYVSRIEEGKTPLVEKNCLSQKQLAGEFAFLNLRLTSGLDLTDYKKRFGIDLLTEFAEDLQNLEKANLICFENNRLKLTTQGMVYSNEVFQVFV